jgi:uncharacterized protein
MPRKAIPRKIQGIVSKIAFEYKPEKIILFGSYAWGKPDKDSDIDLLIVKRTNKNIFERNREVYGIIFDKGEAVDVLVYTPSQLIDREKLGDPFVKKIIREGKQLYAAK